jgi:hypothetical protein
MYGNFEYTTDLQYKVKNLEARIRAFESGEKYVRMRETHKSQIAEKTREIKKLKNEIANLRRRNAAMIKKWWQVNDDVTEEHAKEIAEKDREIKAQAERILEVERQRDAAKDKIKDMLTELYKVKTELEEEQGRNAKLTAQINHDYENSSLPSSLKPNHKPIASSREKTGKSPGGQPGHEGHKRKWFTPTMTVRIPPPSKYADHPERYRLTGKTVRKQDANLRFYVEVCEYETPEYRDVLTGQRVHAQFPDGVVNDVNYGGSIKTFAFLLNTYCCVSIGKVKEILSEITKDDPKDNELTISTGMISNLSKEFANKTEDERKKIFSDMLLSPVMLTDFTSARVSGKNSNVGVCATPNGLVTYFARKHKGHEGVKGSPVEDFQGTLVHDHDLTYYNYGTNHQECSSHVLRYLKDSMDNENDLKWNENMRDLIREAIHYKKSIEDGKELDPVKVAEIESRFDEILGIAKDEYEYEPPSKYYKDGFNLFERLGKFRDNHLLFLHDPLVPPDNNLSERLLRIIKRKMKQVMALRSFESLEYLCSAMTMIASLRAQEQSLYANITEMFDR